MRVYLKNNSIFISPDDLAKRGTDYPINSLTVEIATAVSNDFIQISSIETRTLVLLPIKFDEILDEIGNVYGGTVIDVFDALTAFVNSAFPVVIDTSSLATKDNQTNGLQRVKITDGTDNCTITNQNIPATFATIKFKQDALSIIGTKFTITDPVFGVFNLSAGVDWIPQASIALDIAAIVSALNTVVTGYTSVSGGNIVTMTRDIAGNFPGINWTFNNIPPGAFSLDSINFGTDSIPGKIGLDVNVINTTNTNIANTPDVVIVNTSPINVETDQTQTQTALGCDWDNLPKCPDGQATCILNIKNTSFQKMKLESVSFSSIDTTGFIYARIRIMLNTTYNNAGAFVSNTEHPNIEYDLGNDGYKTDTVGIILAEFIAKVEDSSTWYSDRVLSLNNGDVLNVEITPKGASPTIFISANLHFIN